MSLASEQLKNSRKIVIKIGSNTISDPKGHVDKEVIKNLVHGMIELINQGKQIVIVSSGARICGVGAINKWYRKEDMNYKQALCAIGQVELMNAYQQHFFKEERHVAQILLTRDDFYNKKRSLNIRNTLFTLVDEGVVPIVNENDSVCVDEIMIGDNDTLAAYTAKLWNADLCILLSDIDGVYTEDPKVHPEASIILEIRDLEALENSIEMGGKSSFGTGGIQTKISAAKICTAVDIPVLLAYGREENILQKLMEDEVNSTLFTRKR